MVQFFHFVAFFTIFTFGTDYFGKCVYGGDADAADGSDARREYDDGVQAGNLALALHTLVACLTIMSLPFLIAQVGIRWILYITNTVLACTLVILACLENPSRWTATALVASMGLASGPTIMLPRQMQRELGNQA